MLNIFLHQIYNCQRLPGDIDLGLSLKKVPKEPEKIRSEKNVSKNIKRKSKKHNEKLFKRVFVNHNFLRLVEIILHFLDRYKLFMLDQFFFKINQISCYKNSKSDFPLKTIKLICHSGSGLFNQSSVCFARNYKEIEKLAQTNWDIFFTFVNHKWPEDWS